MCLRSVVERCLQVHVVDDPLVVVLEARATFVGVQLAAHRVVIVAALVVHHCANVAVLDFEQAWSVGVVVHGFVWAGATCAQLVVVEGAI